MKRGVFSSLIFFDVLAAASIILFFYNFSYINPQKKLLTRGLYDKTKAAVLIASPGIDRALKNDDDVSLFSQVEAIRKIEDVRSVYILDGDGRVVSHDKIDEWGKTYDNKILKRAVESRKMFWQDMGTDGFLYSSPLSSSVTLCIELSRERIGGQISSAKKNAVFSGAAMLVFAIFIFAAFAHYRIAVPFKELDHVLRLIISGAAGKIEIKRNDEFGNIKNLLNDLIDARNASNSHDADASGYLKLFEEALEQCDYGVAAIDSENKVAAVNGRAKDLLKLGMENHSGKHILDVFKSPAVLDLLQRVGDERIVEQAIDNLTIKAVAVSNGIIVIVK